MIDIQGDVGHLGPHPDLGGEQILLLKNLESLIHIYVYA